MEKATIFFCDISSVFDDVYLEESSKKYEDLLEKIEKFRLNSQSDKIIFSLFSKKGLWSKQYKNLDYKLRQIIVTLSLSMHKYPNIQLGEILCKGGNITLNNLVNQFKDDTHPLYKKMSDYVCSMNDIYSIKEIILMDSLECSRNDLINKGTIELPVSSLFVKGKFEYGKGANLFFKRIPEITEIYTKLNGIDGAIYLFEVYSCFCGLINNSQQEIKINYSKFPITLSDDFDTTNPEEVFKGLCTIKKNEPVRVLAKKRLL